MKKKTTAAESAEPKAAKKKRLPPISFRPSEDLRELLEACAEMGLPASEAINEALRLHGPAIAVKRAEHQKEFAPKIQERFSAGAKKKKA